jgi:hypothetical protein
MVFAMALGAAIHARHYSQSRPFLVPGDHGVGNQVLERVEAWVSLRLVICEARAVEAREGVAKAIQEMTAMDDVAVGILARDGKGAAVHHLLIRPRSRNPFFPL